MSQLKVLRFDTEIKGNCKEKGYEDWILLEDLSFAGGRDVQMGGAVIRVSGMSPRFP